MYTLGQYLFSLDDPHGLLRTLDGLEPERGADGRPVHAVGNSAAVFRVRCGGRRMALRCFLRPMRHLREIYGERLHERELFLYTAPDKGFWTDVVLTDWIEGPTLREAIDRAVADGDAARLGELARRFDALAAELIADDTAHGDLKPENLVVGAEGQLHPIDLDAMFLPAFAGERSPELFEREGRWGFRLAGQVVIPPLYDNGFDFTEGLAAVRLGQTWHYIDPAGRTRLSCPGCQAVKPFRNGRAQIVRNGRRAAIDPSGRILEN